MIKLKNKEFIIALLLSLNIHLTLAIALQVDFNKLYIKLSQVAQNLNPKDMVLSVVKNLENLVSYQQEKVNEVIKQPTLKQKAQELSEVTKEIKEDTLAKLEELKEEVLQAKEEVLKDQIKEGNDKKEGEKYKNPTDPGFGGFLPPPIEVDLVYEPKKEEVMTPLPNPPKPEEITVQVVQSPPVNNNCLQEGEKFFYGVGLSFAPHPQKKKFHMVVQVPKGYPASEAGLQVGDLIEGDPTRFKGEKDSFVNIDYFRNEQKVVVKVQRKKICYKDEKTKPMN